MSTDTPNARAGASTLRIAWIYPDLLSTYGDRGNALIMAYRARARGIPVERLDVTSDQPIPRQVDIYLIGGGEDRPQRLAAARLREDGGMRHGVADGAAVLAVCAGYQLVGECFHDEVEGTLPGLGLLDVRSERGVTRSVGELVAEADPTLGLPTLTGFENHMGTTVLGQGAAPLGRVRTGVGNGDPARTEGAHSDRVIGTYLHGPVLARNPALADLLLARATGASTAADLPALDDTWHERLRAERLAAAR